jgi:hypothetical protein
MPVQLLLLCLFVEIYSMLVLIDLQFIGRNSAVQFRTIDYQRPVNG